MKSEMKNKCRLVAKGRSYCSTGVRVVTLLDKGTNAETGIPDEVMLCQHHHQELKEKGILQFFKIHRLNELDLPEEEPALERHMTYLDPGVLEGVANARKSMQAGGGYGCVPGFEDLRQTNIKLEEMSMTDKQLMAICLVFYGGIKKKHAARAMKISAQALSDHIKAALKKIKGTLCHSL